MSATILAGSELYLPAQLHLFMSRSVRSFRHGLQELADHRVSIMPDEAEMEAVTRRINYEKLPIVYGITSRRQAYRILVGKRGGQALAIIKFDYRYRRINKHVGKLLSMFIVLLITGSG